MRNTVTVGGGGSVPAEQPTSVDMSGAWAPEVLIRRRLPCNVLAELCQQALGRKLELDTLRVFSLSKGKIESRRADLRTADLISLRVRLGLLYLS
jgi:hypothetical protein